VEGWAGYVWLVMGFQWLTVLDIMNLWIPRSGGRQFSGTSVCKVSTGTG
jgi:hypothetical protein